MPALRDCLSCFMQMHSNVFGIDMFCKIVCDVLLSIDFGDCQVSFRDPVLDPKLIDSYVTRFTKTFAIGHSLGCTGVSIDPDCHIVTEVSQHAS